MGRLGFLLCLLLAAGCAPGRALVAAYLAAAPSPSPGPERPRIVVLLLVDGLTPGLLAQELRRGALPSLAAYFSADPEALPTAQAVFPSLTYPNITSILKGRDVSRHKIIGNSAVLGGEVHDFTDPFHIPEFNRILDREGAFSLLSRRGRRSASLSFYFRAGATASFEPDLGAGLAYVLGRYDAIDRRSIEALEHLLRRVPAAEWPALLFVHLIGVDALSHALGPGSPRPAAHLRELDARLGPALQLLRVAEQRGTRVTTVLTADHGFVATPTVVDLARRLPPSPAPITVLNGHRALMLHFARRPPLAERSAYLRALLRSAGVGAVAWRADDEITVEGHQGALRLRYRPDAAPLRCAGVPVELVLPAGQRPPQRLGPACAAALPVVFPRWPALAPALAAYFLSPHHPDGLVLADEGVVFLTERGSHGGLTPEEMTVPLLSRGLPGPPYAGEPAHLLLRRVLSLPDYLLAEEPLDHPLRRPGVDPNEERHPAGRLLRAPAAPP